MIRIGDYAKEAGLNPGIVYGCLSISIVFSSLIGYLWFRESLTKRTLVGISVVIIGVIWVSMANSRNY